MPPILSLMDILTFGAAAIILTTLVVAVSFGKYGRENWEKHKTGILIGWTVAMVAWLILGVRVWWNVRARNMIDCVLQPQRITVVLNRTGVSCDEVDAEIARTVKLWEGSTGWQDLGRHLRDLRIGFTEDPITHPNWPGKRAGEYDPRTHTIRVVAQKPLRESALAHEIGHVIYGMQTKAWNADDMHNFAKERGLP